MKQLFISLGALWHPQIKSLKAEIERLDKSFSKALYENKKIADQLSAKHISYLSEAQELKKTKILFAEFKKFAGDNIAKMIKKLTNQEVELRELREFKQQAEADLKLSSEELETAKEQVARLTIEAQQATEELNRQSVFSDVLVSKEKMKKGQRPKRNNKSRQY